MLAPGRDMDPSFYGQEPDALLAATEPQRDRFELALVPTALDRGLPILGICRGMQVLNVALGGTLVQDIPSERPSPVVHQRTRDEKTRRDHRVAIAPGTRLAALAGAPDAAVNSRHHQAVDRVAPGLTVSAVAPDGVAEAVESAGDPWLVAVQWHPENLAGDPVSERLFGEFLRVARSRSGG